MTSVFNFSLRLICLMDEAECASQDATLDPPRTQLPRNNHSAREIAGGNGNSSAAHTASWTASPRTRQASAPPPGPILPVPLKVR